MGTGTSAVQDSDTTNCSRVGLACREGNFALLKSLLKSGQSVEVRDSRGWAPIHEAVAHQHLDCVKLLIQHKSNDINWRGFHGETPLLLAARNGDDNIVDVLLNHNANPNLSDNMEETPLHSATICNSLACVKLLVRAGADINHQSVVGSSPLHTAIAISNLPIIEFFVQNGAKLDICTNNQISPIFLAAQYGHLDCLEFLLNEAKKAGLDCLIDYANSNGDTPLMAAAQTGKEECLILLLDNGANPNERNFDNALALHSAVQKGHMNCVKILLERTDRSILFSTDHLQSSSELYKSSFHGKHSASLLHLAVIYKRHEILKCLLEVGLDANVFLEDAEWYFPSEHLLLRLHMGHVCGLTRPRFISALGVAVVMESKQDIVALINAGCHTEPDSLKIIAPLTIAVFEGYTDIVEMLLSYGASPNYLREVAPQVCPYPLIAATNDHRTLRILLKAGSDPRSSFPVGDHKCWSSVETYIRHSHGGWVFCRLAKVLAVYQEFLGHRITMDYLLNVHRKLVEIYKFQGATHLWKHVFKISATPLNLAQLCRLKIRECIMDNGNCTSLPHQINCLSTRVPSQIVQYLNFDY